MGNCGSAGAVADDGTIRYSASSTDAPGDNKKNVIKIPRHPENSDHEALERNVDRDRLHAKFQQRERKFFRQLSDDYGELLNPELYERKYFIGLRNLGNTCFMNSSIQCLANITPLSKHFLSEQYEGELNTKSKHGLKGAIAKEYYELLLSVWGLSHNNPVYAPKAFKKCIGKYHRAFRGTQQHDAHELLTFLLNGLHEDLNRVQVKPVVEDVESNGRDDDTVSAEAWYSYLLRDRSIIVDLFQGQLKSSLTCKTCNTVSTKFDPFMYLSLPIPKRASKRGPVSLQDCIEEFTRGETIDGWKCPKCKKHRKAIKRMHLWMLPPVIVVHLKRFSQTGLGRFNKVTDHVDFPLNDLDLNQYTIRYKNRPKGSTSSNASNAAAAAASRDSKSSSSNGGARRVSLGKNHYLYDLNAVVNHMGQLGSGHYNAYCKNSQREWYVCDDSNTRKVSPNAVCSRAAYVLFFVRKTVSWDNNPVIRQSISMPHLWPHDLEAVPGPILKHSETLKHEDDFLLQSLDGFTADTVAAAAAAAASGSPDALNTTVDGILDSSVASIATNTSFEAEPPVLLQAVSEEEEDQQPTTATTIAQKEEERNNAASTQEQPRVVNQNGFAAAANVYED